MNRRLLLLLLAGLAAAAIVLLANSGSTLPQFNGHDMALVPAGSFDMGDSLGIGYPEDGETPVHRVSIDAFWIDRYEVTNEQFQRFVDETGYRTEAEQFGWSGVPLPLIAADKRARYPSDPNGNWEPHWRKVDGANWRCPEGPGSSIEQRLSHPVVHVSWNDAVAYCRWLSKKTGAVYRLPTEAEWEYAARGGLERANLPWGNDQNKNGRWCSNLWQGVFPTENTGEDGFVGAAPVGHFEPNGYGLYDISGNVWEWCSDWFDPQYYRQSPSSNPQGPKAGQRKVQRGGSYLCCDQCCRRYRVAARFHNDPDSGMANSGFRCVRE